MNTVGRGVLIDYWKYAQDNGKKYDPYSRHAITLSEIQACAKAQGTIFQYGDILIIRTGFVHNYGQLDSQGRKALAGTSTYVGVDSSDEMVDFLHDSYFAAVAGDAPAFEAWPPPQTWNCHEFLLARWGCPIGEMWDLERLSEACDRHGRYHFFFTSSPANVLGELCLESSLHPR